MSTRTIYSVYVAGDEPCGDFRVAIAVSGRSAHLFRSRRTVFIRPLCIGSCVETVHTGWACAPAAAFAQWPDQLVKLFRLFLVGLSYRTSPTHAVRTVPIQCAAHAPPQSTGVAVPLFHSYPAFLTQTLAGIQGAATRSGVSGNTTWMLLVPSTKATKKERMLSIVFDTGGNHRPS